MIDPARGPTGAAAACRNHKYRPGITRTEFHYC